MNDIDNPLRRTSLHALILGSAVAAASIWAASMEAQTLTHRYSFSESSGSTFADSVGGATWDGTLMGTATLDGAQLQLDGAGSYGVLPSDIMSGYTNITIEFWASFSPDNPVWTRVFAFGDQTETGGQRTGLDYCHYAGGDWQNLNLNGVYANNPGGLNGLTNVHVTAVVNPGANKMFYYNGTRQRSDPNINGGSVPPLSAITDTLNYIGKSLWDQDATLIGSIDEFRIYEGAVTPATIAINDAAGPDKYVTDPGALQAVLLRSDETSLIINQNSQQFFTGDFANVSGVNLAVYGGAAFTSLNPQVATVDGNSGLVRAVGAGTTTIVGTFGTLSASNTLTVAAAPAVLTHRWSFNTDASDSVGGANGTLMGSAAITGGKVVLDGSDGTYVDLPGPEINIGTNKSVTVEVWADIGETPLWSRLFDFGQDNLPSEPTAEFYGTPFGPGNGGGHRAISQNFAGGRTIDWQGSWTNASIHLTVVIDPPSSTLAVYRNGLLEFARSDASAALTLVSNTTAVLGRSLFPNDPFLIGSIDEFRIYSGALTPAEIAMTEKAGPSSTNRDPGALSSIQFGTTAFPAYSSIVPPKLVANYANLTNFNLLPNNSAVAAGLSLASGNTNVLQVLPNNMLSTFAPGSTTLTASYQGKTVTATVSTENLAVLTHRYSFNTNADDLVGTANGTLLGNATVTDGQVVLDGSDSTYVELPPGLLEGYDAVTVDTWVTFGETGTWSRLWYFGDDRADEFYVSPSVSGGNSHWFSTGFPFGGQTLERAPQWANETLHITAIYGDGVMELYTNGVLEASATGVTGTTDEIGTWFSWIGRSPYADPLLIGSVDEFRIYRGRLSADQVMQSETLGPNQLLSAAVKLGTAFSNGQLTLTWPSSAQGYTLQSTTNLLGGNWSAVTNAPTSSGGTTQVTVPTTATAQFFRLSSQ